FFFEKPIDRLGDLFVEHAQDADLAIGSVQDLLAVAVNPLALVIHDLVIFEEVLTDIEVSLLDLLLSGFDAPGDVAVFNRLTFLHAHLAQHVGDPFAGKDAHEIVLERKEEAAGTGVALAAGTAAELIIDAAGLVALGANNVQAALACDLTPF